MSAKAAVSKKSAARMQNGFVLSVPYTEAKQVFHLSKPYGRFTEQDFEQFCAENPDLRVELTKEGRMIIMMPVTPIGSRRNQLLTLRLGTWAEDDASGVVFESSAGFTLPNGAKRSPDASWMKRARWETLTEKEKDEFTRICPDFVVELRSKSDRLKALREKMEEYLDNGAQLGWLIDPIKKRVYVYRPNLPVEILNNPAEISGEPLLKGFVLKLAGILD